jgi:adenylate cyclase
MVSTLRERESILQTFGRLVEPAVRDRLLAGDLQPGGELRRATVLFVDLRDFSGLAERAPPSEVVKTLNAFFTVMTGWVRECGGYVDKFVGDGMLVIFGLFEDQSDASQAAAAAAAIRCATGMRGRLADLNRRRAETGSAPLAMKIGVHSGDVVAGTIGAQERHDYTVIGDTVNVAARLQELCREQGHDVLASDAAYRLAAKNGTAPPALAVSAATLRGRESSVLVYQLR